MPRLWTIRDETLAAIDRGTLERFVRALCAHLGEEFPAVAERLGPRDFRRAVERGIRSAATFGIDIEADVAAFLELYLASEQDVEGRWPWAGRILRNTELTARTRLEQINLMRA